MTQVSGVLAAAFAFVLAAAPVARGAFERPPWNVADAALGGLVAVSDDGVWGNPARLAHSRWPRVAEAQASHPFGLAELSEVQITAGMSGAGRGIGVGVRRFGADVYAEREARVALAFGSGGSAVGVAVRGMEADGEGFPAVRTVATDAGVVAEVGGLRLGAVVEAVAGDVPGDPRAISRRAALGVSRRAGSVGIALELQRRGEDPLTGVVGALWEPLPALRIYGGARGDPATMTWGFAAGMAGVRIEVAVDHPPVVGSTVRVGLRFEAPG